MPLNENQIINKLTKYLSNVNKLALNDDAAAILYDDMKSGAEENAECLVINVDSMATKSDFFYQGNMTWKDFGYKLVVITISDVVAKGANPKYFLSNLSIPPDFPEEHLDLLLEGTHVACQKFRLGYLGGDLGTSEELVASGIVLGSCPTKNLLRRDTVQVGDIVCTTGLYGWTGLAYHHVFNQQLRLQDDSKEIIKHAFSKVNCPHPRIRTGLVLGEEKDKCKIHASIDSSDGLFRSLQLLSTLSNVCLEINTIPVDPRLQNLDLPETLIHNIVFFAGEEFELVFTLDPTEFDQLKTKLKTEIQIIGRVKQGSGVKFVGTAGKVTVPKDYQAWDAVKGSFK